MKTEYPYTVEQDEDGFFFVQFVDLEEAFTQGETLEDAMSNAAEVLSAMLAYRLEDNQVIPEPSECPSNGLMTTPKLEIQAALLLRKAKGKNPHHCPSLKQLDKVAKTLGKRLVLSLE